MSTRYVIGIRDRGQDELRLAEPMYDNRPAADAAAARLIATGRYNSVRVIEQRKCPANGETRIDPITYYLQTDPRGAALYILRPGDVPEGKDVDAYYNRGICVY